MTSIINFSHNQFGLAKNRTEEKENCFELARAEGIGKQLAEKLNNQIVMDGNVDLTSFHSNWKTFTVSPSCEGCSDQSSVIVYQDLNRNNRIDEGEKFFEIKQDCNFETPLEFVSNGKEFYQQSHFMFMGKPDNPAELRKVITAFKNQQG